jgi:molybdenum cofactor cytidylyltransferase
MVAALILAAGESRRMGSPKPLLPFGGSTFLGHLIEQFRASRADPVVVVLGHEAERIRCEVAMGDARSVINMEYREGMLSSIRAGLEALAGEGVEGVLVCPVDHPKVDSALIDRLIERFEETGRPVVLPVHKGRRGHPVLFARSVFDELMAAPDLVGARQVVWDHADEVLEVETEQSGADVDVDTPEEYRKLVGPGSEF